MPPKSPAASNPGSQLTATRRRKVSFVKFTRPTQLPVVGFVSQLRAGEKSVVDRPASAGIGTEPPEMWWMVDQGVLQIGTRHFSISSPAIEHWDCE